tara:strand:+ start:5336 stop:5974 length:639 start_codon:yes stop_codon:yes gene_type:complete
MKVKSFLKNKYVLYFATILAILNLVKYISINDLDSSMLCIILFVLSRYFSKLLAFNILFALSVTYLVSMNNFITEGYTERKEKDTTEKMTTKKKEKKCKDCPDDKCVDGKCVSTFKNNVPSSTPSSIDGHIDKDSTAAKMEGAFNDLANLLGDDGVSSVSRETKNLIEQQQNLMGTLNEMAPALKDARETLDNMNLPSMGDMTKLFKKINKK